VATHGEGSFDTDSVPSAYYKLTSSQRDGIFRRLADFNPALFENDPSQLNYDDRTHGVLVAHSFAVFLDELDHAEEYIYDFTPGGVAVPTSSPSAETVVSRIKCPPIGDEGIVLGRTLFHLVDDRDSLLAEASFVEGFVAYFEAAAPVNA